MLVSLAAPPTEAGIDWNTVPGICRSDLNRPENTPPALTHLPFCGRWVILQRLFIDPAISPVRHPVDGRQLRTLQI